MLKVLFIGDAKPLVEGVVMAGHEVVGVGMRPPPRASISTASPARALLARSKSVAMELQSRVASRASKAPRVLTGDANGRRFVDAARALAPDVILCAGWPQLLRDEVLAVPRVAAINFHMALLPRHRGADPLTWTLLRGDAEAGVTFHRMTSTFDQGSILAQSAFAVGPEDTRGSLLGRALARGVALLPELLARVEAGEIAGAAQDEARASRAPRPTPDDLRVDFELPAVDVARRIRARCPSPGVVVVVDSAPRRGVHVHFARELPVTVETGRDRPGTVTGVSPGLARVATGRGEVLLATSRGGFRDVPRGAMLHT